MNGRVYDPVLGRFLSADPFVDDATTAGAYNRYAYCGNDPLGHTDPSGYFKLKEILGAVIAIVVAAVVIYFMGPAGMSFLEKVAWAASAKGIGVGVLAGAAGGFSGSFSGSLLNGASLGDAFKSGLIGAAVGAATALASCGIGELLGHNPPVFDLGRESLRAAAHGVVGGVAAEIQGGEFRHGFYSSAVSSMVSHSRVFASRYAGVNLAVTATVGGTVAEISGGKFANGAVTSAFQYLFNQTAEAASSKPTQIEYTETYTLTVTSEQIKQAIGDEILSRIKSWATLGTSELIDTIQDLADKYNDLGKNPDAPFVKDKISAPPVRLPKGWVLVGEVRGKLELAGNNIEAETLRKLVNNEKSVFIIQYKRYVHNVFGTIAQRTSLSVRDIYEENKSRIPYTTVINEGEGCAVKFY